MEDRHSSSTDEESPFLDPESNEKNTTSHPPSPRRTLLTSLLPWALVVLLSLYILITSLLPSSSSEGQIWTATDFRAAREAISQKQVTFTSSLDFVNKTNIYRIYDPAELQYVGGRRSVNEKEEIDRNWDGLILPADIYISDEEAKQVGGDLYRNPQTGKYKIELEVFHSLHCLNMVRKRIYSDLYPEMLSHNADIHIDHCIESLRELIMCGGNMTPIPLEWSEKGERLNPNYASMHTCRNFSKLKEWNIGRSKSMV